MRRDERQREFARRMRREPSPAEKILWKLLRVEQLHPYKFRRQHTLGPYVADFYSHAALLVVELDGESHLSAEAQDLDRQRSAYLQSLGVRVERFWNPLVFDESDAVLERIYELCTERAGGRRAMNEVHTTSARFLADTFRGRPRRAIPGDRPAETRD